MTAIAVIVLFVASLIWLAVIVLFVASLIWLYRSLRHFEDYTTYYKEMKRNEYLYPPEDYR